MYLWIKYVSYPINSHRGYVDVIDRKTFNCMMSVTKLYENLPIGSRVIREDRDTDIRTGTIA
jgi:hypothetical protein